MSVRHDALAAAAELVLLAEELGQATEGAVATVGSLEVHPNASNCVPGECGFTLDVRHVEDQVRRQVLEEWLERARAAAERRGVTFVVAARREQASVPCDPILTVLMDQAVAEISGRPGPKLPSGAGHDAMILARVTPIAMLFLRCRGGISHSPEEQVEPGDVAAALAAGANFLRRLAAHPDLARVNRASASSPSLHPSDRSAAAS